MKDTTKSKAVGFVGFAVFVTATISGIMLGDHIAQKILGLK